jgi:hypothetical protein
MFSIGRVQCVLQIYVDNDALWSEALTPRPPAATDWLNRLNCMLDLQLHCSTGAVCTALLYCSRVAHLHAAGLLSASQRARLKDRVVDRCALAFAAAEVFARDADADEFADTLRRIGAL